MSCIINLIYHTTPHSNMLSYLKSLFSPKPEPEPDWPALGAIHILTSSVDLVTNEIFVMPTGFQFMYERNGKDIFCTMTNGGVLIEESETIMSRETFSEMVQKQKEMMIERFQTMKAAEEAEAAMAETLKSQGTSAQQSPEGYI